MKKFFDKAMMWIMAFLMALLLGSALWQVFTRFVLDDPSTFTEELSRYALIWASMIGAGYAFSNNSHIALTLVKDRVHGPVAVVLNIFIELVVWFFAIAILLVGGFALCSRNMGQLTQIGRASCRERV